jgi:hypothetical protein
MKLKPKSHIPRMTRNDYVWIAEVINECPLAARDRLTVAAHFANALVETNENFDRARFLKACGVEG